jgi:thiamine pyrophosphate-dependent acetolactate synthase large subunit-like protein
VIGVESCLHPRELVEVIDRVMPTETTYFVDIGAVTAWVIRHLRPRMPDCFFTDTVCGAMDYAVPAAIGGKLARPDTPVCALVGDGGALMGSILELFSAVEHELAVLVVVFSDAGWGMVEHGVRRSPLRDARRPSFHFRHRADFALLARSLGARGVAVDRADVLEVALREFLDTPVPTVLDVAIDRNAVPPIGGRTAHVNRHMSGD